MATEKTDVVIVGVGGTGGILAAELSKAGMKVIGLERGPRHTTADFAGQDELRYFQRQDLRPNPKRQPVTWRPNVNTRAVPLAPLNYGNQVGGGTVHYGAVSWRFHESDFRVRSQTIERYGASAIPEDCSVIDWPLSYADLEPFYDRAEYDLGVSGKAGNLQGRKIDGGNIFEAPRQREFPLPPLFVDNSARIFEAGAKKLGYHPFSTPRAILSEPYKGRPGCLLRVLLGFMAATRRKIVDPRNQDSGGRRHRQLQVGYGRDVLSREQRQQWTRDRRVLLWSGQLRQYDRGRSRHSFPLHLRRRASAAPVSDQQIPGGTRQFERPSRPARDDPYWRAGVRCLRRSLRQYVHGTDRSEAHDRRSERRQL
jgi:choline dehydrogenase-like flavoprotein